jgi:hypothetical protein
MFSLTPKLGVLFLLTTVRFYDFYNIIRPILDELGKKYFINFLKSSFRTLIFSFGSQFLLIWWTPHSPKWTTRERLGYMDTIKIGKKNEKKEF